MTDPVAVCAAGEAVWHTAAYTGLGARWRQDAGLAWGDPPHRFLLAAVTLCPRPALPEGLAGEVRDSWGALRPEDLPPRWQRTDADRWMLRPPGRCAAPAVPGIRVAATGDALLFERVAFLAAGGRPPDRPGGLHPPGSEAVPGVRLLLAWRGEHPIGSALVVVHDQGVTVSGVAVLAAERRRGIGTALTAAAVEAAVDRPATLSSSALGTGVYRALGFQDAGPAANWSPPAEP